MTPQEASAIARKPEVHDRSTLESALSLLVSISFQEKQRKHRGSMATTRTVYQVVHLKSGQATKIGDQQATKEDAQCLLAKASTYWVGALQIQEREVSS